MLIDSNADSLTCQMLAAQAGRCKILAFTVLIWALDISELVNHQPRKEGLQGMKGRETRTRDCHFICQEEKRLSPALLLNVSLQQRKPVADNLIVCLKNTGISPARGTLRFEASSA